MFYCGLICVGFLALVLISVLVIFSAVNRLIASKINVFVYKIMYAYIYIYIYICIFKYTHKMLYLYITYSYRLFKLHI